MISKTFSYYKICFEENERRWWYERERKREEKNREEQKRQLRLEQKLEEQRQTAEENYQRDLLVWKDQQLRWIEQQQKINFIQHAQQQAQFNLNFVQQKELNLYAQNRQYDQHHQKLQNNAPPRHVPLLLTGSPSQMLPKQTNSQNLTEEHISKNGDSRAETTRQKNISTPHSPPLDSLSAIGIDNLINSDSTSSPQRETAERNKLNERLFANSSGDFDQICNLDWEICNSSAGNSKESIKFNTSCLLSSIDGKGKHISNFNYRTQNDRPNIRSQFGKKNSDDFILSLDINSNEFDPTSTIPACTKKEIMPDRPVEEMTLRPLLIQPCTKTLLQEKGQQRHASPGFESAIDTHYPLNWKTGYGSVIPCYSMRTQTLGNSTHWSSPPKSTISPSLISSYDPKHL